MTAFVVDEIENNNVHEIEWFQVGFRTISFVYYSDAKSNSISSFH